MKQDNIRKRSKKREIMEAHYARIRNEMMERARRDGACCFFCNAPIIDHADVHHLIGRDNDNLIDAEYLVLVHRQCHMTWHSKALSDLYRYDWFSGFMDRVSQKHPSLYESIKQKLNR
jgi:hypothetical protein